MYLQFTILLFLLFLGQARADQFMTLDRFYLEYEKYLSGTSRNLAPGYETKQLPAIGFNFVFLKSAYLRNKISSEVDSSQFRYIALDSELGVRPTKFLEIYTQHYSGHALDSAYLGKFPQDNTIGFRIDFSVNR